MPAVLNTNMASLYAQKNLSTAQADLAGSVQKLSSGKRINTAKDDAAGYAVAEAVKATKNVTDQSIQNTQDAISLVQTAEGALDVVSKILQRTMTLVTQKANSSLTTGQSASIDNEITNLLAEVDQIKSRTKFQGSGDSIFNRNLSFSTGDSTTTALRINDLSLATLAGVEKASVKLDAAASATLGTAAGSFKTSDFTMRVNDSSGALTSATNAKLQVLVNGALTARTVASLGPADSSGNLTVTLDALTGINAGDTVSFRKFEASSTLIALTGAADAAGEFIDGTATNGATLVVNDTAGALKVGQKVYNGTTDTGLTVASVATASATRAVTLTAGATAFAATNVIRFSSALSSASTTADLTTAIQNNIAERASLGAWQNRLNYIVDNMQTLSNNLADAQSRIVDTNYAAETANLTRGQILQQAATSMLAQANQMPNVILTLLK